MQEEWGGEQDGGEEEIAFESAAEEGEAGVVAGQESREILWIHVPSGPDREVAHQEERDRTGESGGHDTDGSGVLAKRRA